MVRIKVLGPGCRNCQLVAQNTAEALEAIAQEQQQPDRFDATMQKVTQAEEIMKYPILYTPGLVINEKLCAPGVCRRSRRSRAGWKRRRLTKVQQRYEADYHQEDVSGNEGHLQGDTCLPHRRDAVRGRRGGAAGRQDVIDETRCNECGVCVTECCGDVIVMS